MTDERDDLGILLYVTQVAPYPTMLAGAHGVLHQSIDAWAQIAGVSGLRLRHVADVRDLEPGAISRARVVVLFTIGETPWSADQRTELAGGVRSGRLALCAIHAALDACSGWDDYGTLVGARFDGHPWTLTVDLEITDATHPSVRHLVPAGTAGAAGAAGRAGPPVWRWHDEVYQFRDLRPDARVLLRVPLDRLDLDAPGTRVRPWGFPLAWCHEEGRGRVFVSALGHFPGAWESNDFLHHLAGGLAWTIGREPWGSPTGH
jgi:uncharacterized protein